MTSEEGRGTGKSLPPGYIAWSVELEHGVAAAGRLH